MPCDNPKGLGWWGGREAQEGEDICILWADLCCGMAETNTTLQNNYSLILKNVMFLEKKKVVTSIGEEVEKLTHGWGECEMVQPLWNSHSGK